MELAMTHPLRIALVSAFPPGKQSLNEYGLHLAKGLAERADIAEVVVLADRLTDDATELALGPKITIKRCWTFNSLSSLPKLVAAVRATKVDGVLWNIQTATFGDGELTAGMGLLAPMAARLTGTPSGVIAHNLIGGVDLDQTVLKGQPIRQALVRLGGKVITKALLSASYMTVTLRNYRDAIVAKSPNAPVYLVPHGTFDTNANELIPFADRARRIVTMGKFGTYKRLETLLEAFDLLRQTPDNADLELVIGGSDHPNTPGYLCDLAELRKDDKGVAFRGYIAEDDVPDFFGNSKLSVFDYIATTGSSGVLHQTASYGAVPVFPSIGDFVDVCRDEGITGANYVSQDAQDMADQMYLALESPEASQKVANTNRDAANGFPFANVVEFHVTKIRQLQNDGDQQAGLAERKSVA